MNGSAKNINCTTESRCFCLLTMQFSTLDKNLNGILCVSVWTEMGGGGFIF